MQAIVPDSVWFGSIKEEGNVTKILRSPDKRFRECLPAMLQPCSRSAGSRQLGMTYKIVG